MCKIAPLVGRAAEMGMPAIALTDHGNMYGAFEFWREARKVGVKPIVGSEIYLAPGTHRSHRAPIRFGSGIEDVGGKGAYTHMTTLAETTEGMHNLFALVSRASLEGQYHKPRADRELLAQYSKGVIATSGCVGGEIQVYLRHGKYEKARESAAEFRDIFGPENFFFELMDHQIKIEQQTFAELVRLGKELRIPFVATNDLHYVNRVDAKAHDALLCIQTGKNVDDKERFRFDSEEFYLKSPAEMRALFAELPEACDNTLLIAERCDVTFESDNGLLPVFPVPEGETEDSWFVKEVAAGLARRFPGGVPEAHRKQSEYETGVILSMGWAGYHLVTSDVVRYAKSLGRTVGPGRGSAAGSVDVWALGITDLDPLRHNLLFERYLNPDRVSMPDIDMDFDEETRAAVIAYATQKYGADRVAQLVTFGMIKAKAAIKDASKVLGYPFAMGAKITKVMPPPVMGKDIPLSGIFDPSHKRYAEAAEFRALFQADPDVAKIVEVARSIEGTLRSTGVHAAGVIMSSRPLMETLPLSRREADGAIITQFEQSDCEDLGLLKMDFLGLKNLSTVTDTIRLVKKNRGIEIDPQDLSEDPTDPRTFELLARGDTLGVFQLDGGPMRKLLQSMRPDSFGDISAVLALYRPGPMGANAHNDYADRKNGRKPVVAIHPELKEPLAGILGETYGLIVYQEQVMAIAQALAGYSLGNADLLRRAMGKKKKEILDKEYVPFSEGMRANGYSDQAITTLWDILVPFSDYAFNRCVTGDTEVWLGASGSASDGKRTVKELYDRLHANLLPARRRGCPVLHRGACLHCKRDDRPAVWRGRCRACKSWVTKFRGLGLTALSLGADGRVRPRRIKDVHHNGTAECFTVLLEDGRSLTSTGNHRHMTPQGWREVSVLRPGDSVLTVGDDRLSSSVKYDYSLSDRSRQYAGARVPNANRTGAMAPGYIDGGSVRLTERTAGQIKTCRAPGCLRTEADGHRIERTHLDGDRHNNDPSNLRMLCVSHHKAWDYENNGRLRRWEAGKPAVPVRIVSIKAVGLRDVYDLEMETSTAAGDDHERSWVANGILTHNSHTAAYGLVAYWTAYLKANYPAEYMAALLTTNADDKDKTAIYLNECRRMGVKVLSPDVNESSADYTAVGSDIRVGLAAIRGVGQGAVGSLVRTREEKGKYADFADFLGKVEPAVCSKKIVEALIKAGAFDSLGHRRRALHLVHETAVEALSSQKRNEAFGQDSMFALDSTTEDQTDDALTVRVPDVDEWDLRVLLAFEREMLGLYVSDHPLRRVTESLAAQATTTIEELLENARSDGGSVVVGGLVTGIERKITRKGDAMAILAVEDLTGMIECVLFPQTYGKYAHLIANDEVLLFTGRADRKDDGTVSLVVSAVNEPDLTLDPRDARPLVLHTPMSLVTGVTVGRLQEVLGSHKGDRQVHLFLHDGPRTTVMVLGDQYRVSDSPDLVSELKAVLGADVLTGGVVPEAPPHDPFGPITR